jgi:hypothetical protein
MRSIDLWNERKQFFGVLSVSRAEYFAGLYILACGNGVSAHAMKSVAKLGWFDAVFHLFEISLIVWLACFAGLWL